LWIAPLYQEAAKLSVTRARIIIIRSIGTFFNFYKCKNIEKSVKRVYISKY
jgi:hypothetical protein